MEKNNKIMQFIGLDCILMILLTMVDQWTKSLVVHHLKGQSDVILIPGSLPAALSGKPGAALDSAESACGLCGTDRDLSGGVFWFLRRCPKTGRYTLLHIIASVLTAGALGNFIDRLRLGYVVDFFYFSLINFPDI